MREILLVSISALLGYIIFSAFSTSSTFEEGVRKVIEQPQGSTEQNYELALQKVLNDRDEVMAKLENQHKKNEMDMKKDITINEKNKDTLMAMKISELQAGIQQKKQENYTYLTIAFLLFLLVLIYLKYQKHLAQMELEQENEYKEMLAKKEYAEKILALLAAGNLTYDTERKLLKVLDELNGHRIEEKKDIIYHPNPEIAQLNIRN